MTFTEIRTEIIERLNLTSSDALTRVGRAINRKYRLVTSSIGLELSRRITVSAALTPGVSTLTFTGVEKVINVFNRTVTPYRRLSEVTTEELRDKQPFVASDSPTMYSVDSHTSDSVTILINVIPQTAFTLYADVHTAVSDLSGSQEPAFPESFHDILIEGVLMDELRKMEKSSLAQFAQAEYEKILSDLRMWIAKNNFKDNYQGKTSASLGFASSGSGGSSSAPNGALSYTQTGLITFDRDPAAPFAVTSGSAKVDNLDADLLDGQSGSAYHDASLLTGTAGSIKLDDWATPDDNTDLNASTTRHGLLRKLDNTATNFLDGTGAWDSVKDSDLSTSDIVTNDVTTAKHGFVPKAPNSVYKYLRGDASWAQTMPIKLYQTVVPVANSGTGVTTLASFSVPAGLLAVNGDKLHVRVWGSQAANANSKTKILKFGATTIVTRNESTNTHIAWLIEGDIFRTGAATQVTGGFWEGVLSGMQTLTTTPAETLANSIAITLTGQSGTASNDITMLTFEVWFHPAV